MKLPATLFLFACLAACTGNDAAYTQRILQIRANKTYAFLDPATTPLPASKLATFKGLPYFEPDRHYLVKAHFTPTTNAKTFGMAHTLNRNYSYSEAGRLEFELDGKELNLTAFLREGIQGDTVELFIPFTDATNGTDTYGGGRYLDIKAGRTQPEIEVDFNLAYNPYCAYNLDFSCPIPPKENDLEVAIRAGEKYKHEE